MQWLRDTEKNSTIDEEIFWVGLFSLVLPFLSIIVWILFSKYRRDVKQGYHNPSVKAVIGFVLSFVPLGYLGFIFYMSFYV